ncbi:MAG: M28 family peptidase [Planctomycetes bacterium]|jgi:leucyl aminopeptidase|nr:M28 family peptidase [Planctomycetota bacterium]
MRRLLSALLVLPFLTAAPAAQSAGQPISDLHLVDFGTDLTVRTALIQAGAFYGDLGRTGLARLGSAAAQAAVAGVTTELLGPVQPGEVLVVSARTRSGAGAIHGRLLRARRSWFVTAAVPATLPSDCHSSGFHGGVQVFSLAQPYAAPRGTGTAPVAATASLLGTGPDPRIATMVAEVNQANLSSHVQALAAIFTRRANRAENAQAVTYVTNRLTQLGLPFTTQTFSTQYGPNIVVEIPGTELANEIVMVGAHLDSIAGTAANRSPGADDNASGSAAVLEIARIFSTRQFRRTVRFAWWNAEEFGLVGSRAYAQNAAAQNQQIVAYINTDMNAYRAPGDTYSVDYVTNDSTPSLITALVGWTQTYVPALQTNVGPLSAGTSDHRAFFENGFAAAFPFEDLGNWTPFIHTSNDDFVQSTNDFVRSRMITQSVLAGLAELAEPALANPALFEPYGQGCAGTGVVPPTCVGVNTGGGVLEGLTRSWEYAYRVSSAQPETLSSFDVFLRSTTGGNVTVGAYVYATNGTLPSGTPLASTSITVGPVGAFYTATLPTPVAVNGTFWVSIDHSAQTTTVSELTAGSAGVGCYRTPGTGTWQQSTLIQQPAVRLGCGGGVNNAVPTLGNAGLPIVASTFSITLARAKGLSLGVLATGFSDTSYAGIPLPWTIPGAGPCQLFASGDLSAVVATDAGGSAALPLPIPDQAALIGGRLYHQWLVFDPSVNSFGFVVSGAARSTIGG